MPRLMPREESLGRGARYLRYGKIQAWPGLGVLSARLCNFSAFFFLRKNPGFPLFSSFPLLLFLSSTPYFYCPLSWCLDSILLGYHLALIESFSHISRLLTHTHTHTHIQRHPQTNNAFAPYSLDWHSFVTPLCFLPLFISPFPLSCLLHCHGLVDSAAPKKRTRKPAGLGNVGTSTRHCRCRRGCCRRQHSGPFAT